jgi:hypothetical protein
MSERIQIGAEHYGPRAGRIMNPPLLGRTKVLPYEKLFSTIAAASSGIISS